MVYIPCAWIVHSIHEPVIDHGNIILQNKIFGAEIVIKIVQIIYKIYKDNPTLDHSQYINSTFH